MTAGFPTKANWSAGDLLTSAQMDDLAGTVNYLSPVGQANGSTLVANSANSSGLGWSATPSASNPVLNSAMQVWQRGTSGAGANGSSISGYMADRWLAIRSSYTAGLTISRQVTADTTNLPNIQYCARIQRDSSNASTVSLQLGQSFESVNSIPFAGKTVTLSFYARAGANYSSTSNALLALLVTGTGTDQNVVTAGYTGTANTISQTATLTTTWQRFQYTGAIPTTTTEIGLIFQSTPTGTAGANDYFEITGVQIDVGSVALPFRTFSQTLQGELSACQRYFLSLNNNVTATADYFNGGYYSTTGLYGVVNFPVQMRVAPSTSFTAGSTFQAWIGGSATTCSAIGQNITSPLSASLYVNTTAKTAGSAAWVSATGSVGTSAISFSAEL